MVAILVMEVEAVCKRRVSLWCYHAVCGAARLSGIVGLFDIEYLMMCQAGCGAIRLSAVLSGCQISSHVHADVTGGGCSLPV